MEPKGSQADDFRYGTIAAAAGGGNWFEYFPGFRSENRPIKEAPVIAEQDMPAYIEELKKQIRNLPE